MKSEGPSHSWALPMSSRRKSHHDWHTSQRTLPALGAGARLASPVPGRSRGVGHGLLQEGGFLVSAGLVAVPLMI